MHRHIVYLLVVVSEVISALISLGILIANGADGMTISAVVFFLFLVVAFTAKISLRQE